jgi:glycerol kinase
VARQLILAIDQGTTGSTALVVDDTLTVRGKASREFRQVFPKPGQVEHEASAIWESVEASVAAALQAARAEPKELAAIGITNQRETTCLFDRQGQPLHNFIVWQDRRTAGRCAELKAQGLEPRVREKTGLVIDPYFAGTKMQWLLENVAGAREKARSGEARFGTIDTWLVHKLSGGAAYITDATNASRTLFLDLKTVAWDDEMLAMLDVPKKALPEVRSSSEVYGKTRGLSFLPDGIPIAGIAGDQQSALFGQACFTPGEAKCTYGTGAFLLLHTGDRIVPSTQGLITTIASKIGDEVSYALEGAAFIAGAAVQWLRDGLGLITQASEIEALARSVDDAGDVCFVPALAGLGAPHWQPHARGLLCGLSRDTHKGHIARAVLEGIALQNVEVLAAMTRDAGALTVLKVDGGASANDLLMQLQADFLDVPCVRPQNVETTALGAAYLAGIATGLWDQEGVAAMWRERATYEPRISADERESLLNGWQRAVERSRNWASEGPGV